jgi:hypothetical protein
MFKLSVIITLLFLAGCQSTPQTTMPTYRLNSPEVNSTALKIKIGGGTGNESSINLNTYKEGDLVDINSNTVNNLTPFAQVSIVAVKGLKFVVSDDTGLGIKALYQFYGLNADNTVEGNFSQALSLGYLTNDDQGDYDLDYDSLYPYYDSHWKQKTKIIDFAWISGYRINADFLIYGGPFFQRGKSKVTETLSALTNEVDKIVSKKQHKGNLYGANIAFEYRLNFGLGFTGEVVYSKAEWSKSTINGASFNFKVDYQF